MPITKSAKKALRQNKKRRKRNAQKSRFLKDQIKALKKLIIAKDKKGVLDFLPKVYKAIDKSAKTNIIVKNTAARIKSRLTKMANKL